MKNKTFTIVITILMLMLGIFFTSNIYVLGNTAAAIEMHDDLPRNASPIVANGKVILCFIVGIAFIVTSISIFRKQYRYTIIGAVAGGIFVLSYLVQMALWLNEHPRMLIDFSIAGTINFLFAAFSWSIWRRNKQQIKTE